MRENIIRHFIFNPQTLNNKNLKTIKLDCENLGNYLNVKTLTLDSCSITEIRILRDMFPYLIEIDLSETQIPTKKLRDLSKFTNLSHLDLSLCEVNGKAISKLTNLRKLDLNFCSIRNLSLVSKLTNLGELDLTNCCITNLSFISKLINLECLNFKTSNINDEDLSHLSKLTNLKNLDISNCWNITDHGLDYLANLTKLTVLNLMFCDLSNDRLDDLITNLTGLSHLYFAGVDYITGE